MTLYDKDQNTHEWACLFFILITIKTLFQMTITEQIIVFKRIPPQFMGDVKVKKKGVLTRLISRLIILPTP